MSNHNKINYIEFPASDLSATKTFYTSVFGWTFQDYGSEYSAFTDAGLDGGFYASSKRSDSSDNGAALVVLYSDDLEDTMQMVEQAGGSICKLIFSFPGGRRFHFLDPYAMSWRCGLNNPESTTNFIRE